MTVSTIKSHGTKVAIIGIGLRLPGNIRDLNALYKALMSKTDLVSRLPDDRFSQALYLSAQENSKGHSRTFMAGHLDNIFAFDYKALGLSRKEAESMDIQQRLCLEMTIDAFTDANIKPSSVLKSKLGVYIGAASTDMAMSHADDTASISPYAMTGTNLSIISNRISYYLDVHGPSMTVDTACSSSLVALDLGVNYVREHRDEMCLVGGVNVLLSPLPFIGFSQAHMLSPDGSCKVFSEGANGYVRAEGGAVLLIKDYEKAVREGDRIIATIVDSRVNHDGRTLGISLPNGKAQSDLLSDIYDGVDLKRMIYVEAHGTGTRVGDPIEVSSIGQTIGKKVKASRRAPLLVGSIKSNTGHLETASGMAGILKAILVLQHHEVPPNIHVTKDTLNKKINFDELGLKPVLEVQPTPEVHGLGLIGVNSFGFGGTNAHVILEEYDRMALISDAEYSSVKYSDVVRGGGKQR